MNTRLFALLLTSLAAAAACGGTETTEPTAQPGPEAPSPGEPPAAPPPPAAPTACSVPLVDPACATTKPAPSSKAAIEQFVKDEAVPLRCTGGDTNVWDLRPLVDLYGDQKIFALGEVHGTNEIGIVSSLLLEQLASKGLVNVLAYELPMDFEASLQRWVDTGVDPQGDRITEGFAKNFFGSILTKTARELKKKGISLRVGAVDIPTSPDFAREAIAQIAAKLTTQKATVTATLATAADDTQKANAYFDLITGQKTQICAELPAEDCERLVVMTHALWASATSSDFGGDDALWFQRREEVIYYNLKSHVPSDGDRMYLHMGAAHTNKYSFSGGSRMAKEYALTKGRMFSIAPAYGDGSVIWYGGDQDLPADPQTIVDALSSTPDHPFFVSTTRPSKSCEGNPLGEEAEQSVGTGGKRGEVYDGYIHYGRLTSEKKPSETKLSRDDGVAGAAVAAFRARVLERERRAIASGRLLDARPRR